MQVIDNGKFIKLVADEGMKIFSPSTDSYHDYVVLGKNDSGEKFKEVKDPNPIIYDTDTINDIIDDNDIQYDLIDTSFMAIDEIFMMFEPFLAMMPMTLSMEEVISPMVELYVVMIQRGLKTLDQVPVRYREQVSKLLDEVEE